MERVDSLVLFLFFMESLWVSLYLIWYWLSACCILPLLCLGLFLVSLISKTFIMKGCLFSQRLFKNIMISSCGCFLSVCLYSGLHGQSFIYWTIPASLRWRWLDHGVWFFLMCSCIRVASILLSIFASMFMSETGL